MFKTTPKKPFITEIRKEKNKSKKQKKIIFIFLSIWVQILKGHQKLGCYAKSGQKIMFQYRVIPPGV